MTVSADTRLEDCAALVGIDWADRQHVLALVEVASGRRERATLDQTPEAIDAWVAGLRRRFGGRPVAVCLEQSRGGLIWALLKYEFLLLCPLAPARLASYRDAFSTSGAKDDPTDAELLLDYLERHGDQLHPWGPDDPLTRELALLVEGRRKLVDLRTKLSNQLTSLLKSYFPQALTLFEKPGSRLACELLRKWPTLQALQRAQDETIRMFYYAQNCRRGDLIEQRIAAIRAATPLVTDQAILQSSTLIVQALARQLRDLAASIATFDRRIAHLFQQHPDAGIFQSPEGAGPALAPRLLVAFGTDRDRLAHAGEMQAYSGIAPVTKRSGKRHSVYRRWACSKFLRQTFHEFAAHSCKKSTWAAAYYQLQRDRGKGHHTALRALAFKWIRILFRCWKDRVPYDEDRYLAQLAQRNSPLVEHLQTPTNACA
jgi:transposase